MLNFVKGAIIGIALVIQDFLAVFLLWSSASMTDC